MSAARDVVPFGDMSVPTVLSGTGLVVLALIVLYRPFASSLTDEVILADH